VLFLLFGSSASGKSVALTELRARQVPRLAVHDFDEIGVPAEADRAWRQRANEIWLGRALDHQAEGTDMLLAGQTPSVSCWPPRRRLSSTGSPRACSTATTRHALRGFGGARRATSMRI